MAIGGNLSGLCLIQRRGIPSLVLDIPSAATSTATVREHTHVS